MLSVKLSHYIVLNAISKLLKKIVFDKHFPINSSYFKSAYFPNARTLQFLIKIVRKNNHKALALNTG